jgi:hypothetical protein
MTKPKARDLHPLDEDQFRRFAEAYGRCLVEAVLERPADYGYGPEQVPVVVGNMMKAIRANTHNHGGRGLALTCRELGIRHTRTAIDEYLFHPPVAP